jgi:hypothetical protein
MSCCAIFHHTLSDAQQMYVHRVIDVDVASSIDLDVPPVHGCTWHIEQDSIFLASRDVNEKNTAPHLACAEWQRSTRALSQCHVSCLGSFWSVRGPFMSRNLGLPVAGGLVSNGTDAPLQKC